MKKINSILIQIFIIFVYIVVIGLVRFIKEVSGKKSIEINRNTFWANETSLGKKARFNFPY